jgi:fluoride exporter
MAGALSMRRRWLAVLCGGFFGALARYGLGILMQGWWGKSWPFDILFINLTGACLLALITTLADATFLIGPTRRLLLNTGFLGAYTTFSTFALGDVLLLSKGAWAGAVLYLVLSIAGGLLAVVIGDWLGQMIIVRFKRTTGKLAALKIPPFKDKSLDIQDDILLPDQIDTPGSKRA